MEIPQGAGSTGFECVALVGDECGCTACLGLLPGLVEVEPMQQTLPGLPAPMVTVKRYRAYGKEVLQDGVHYGDMIDENAAKRVADAMNGADEQAKWAQYIVNVK
jgi:hypothetical protein